MLDSIDSNSIGFRLRGVRVLITAGASGIGLQTAKTFAALGARVAICDIDRHALDRASGLGIKHGYLADVTDRASVQTLFEGITRDLGGLDLLINNAGIPGPTGRIDTLDPLEWDRTLAVNVTGHFNCIRLAIPLLQLSINPAIVNVSSAAGRVGYPLRTAYAASKWAVVGLTKSLSIELGPLGIRVNAVLPGMVDGPRMEALFEKKAKTFGIDPIAMREKALAPVSLRKLVPVDDVVSGIVYLCSQLGRSVSGHTLCIDGDLQMLA